MHGIIFHQFARHHIWYVVYDIYCDPHEIDEKPTNTLI